MLVGPDSESEQWVSAVAELADAPHIVLEKVRRGDKDVEVSVPEVDRYRNHTPVLVDDIISTARTMVETLRHLARAGMPPTVCVGIHAVFASDGLQALETAGPAQIVTCNTIEHSTNEIGLAPALAAAVSGAGGGAGFFFALLAALVQSFRTRRWHLAEDGAQALSGWGVVRVLLLLGAAWLVLIVLALRKFDLYVHDETNGEYSTWRMFQDIFSQVRNNGFDKERWGEWTSDRARGTSGMSAREARSVLGVGADATTSAIRKAHRDLSREWHPDKWHGDVDKLTEAEEMQVRLNLAKDVLMERAPTPDMPDD